MIDRDKLYICIKNAFAENDALHSIQILEPYGAENRQNTAIGIAVSNETELDAEHNTAKVQFAILTDYHENKEKSVLKEIRASVADMLHDPANFPDSKMSVDGIVIDAIQSSEQDNSYNVVTIDTTFFITI